MARVVNKTTIKASDFGIPHYEKRGINEWLPEPIKAPSGGFAGITRQEPPIRLSLPHSGYKGVSLSSLETLISSFNIRQDSLFSMFPNMQVTGHTLVLPDGKNITITDLSQLVSAGTITEKALHCSYYDVANRILEVIDGAMEMQRRIIEKQVIMDIEGAELIDNIEDVYKNLGRPNLIITHPANQYEMNRYGIVNVFVSELVPMDVIYVVERNSWVFGYCGDLINSRLHYYEHGTVLNLFSNVKLACKNNKINARIKI